MKIIKSLFAVIPFLKLFTSSTTKLILTIFILSVILNINSCNSVTEPEIQPGRRDYVWEVDTIKPGNESLYLRRIWGSSPNDIWAVGSSSWTATSIWHYNGKEWRCDSIPRKVVANGLFGVAQNDVWLGSCCGLNTIWRFNGNNWFQFAELNPENGYNHITLNCFDGLSASNIYGVGFTELYGQNKWKAMIMHFNGNNWRIVNIPEIRVGFESFAVDEKSGDLVISGTDYDPKGFVSKVYFWDGRQLKELLSELGGWAFVTKLGNEIFVSYSAKIYKYDNKKLNLWKNNTGTLINGNIICGRNRNDFFISTYEGIAHYNGTNYNTLYTKTQDNNVAIGIGTIFEKDVFFIINDFTLGKNLILHGKLN